MLTITHTRRAGFHSQSLAGLAFAYQSAAPRYARLLPLLRHKKCHARLYYSTASSLRFYFAVLFNCCSDKPVMPQSWHLNGLFAD